MRAEPTRSSFRGYGRDLDLWRLGVLPIVALGALSGSLGIYWDMAWHIDIGRDAFFSPPHLLIYGAMAIVLISSVAGLALDRRASPLHLPVGRARLNPGALLLAVGAAVTLFFAPADDLWHRLFGVDVTLWGPMHLVGIVGFTMLAFGGLVGAWLERSLAATPARRRGFGWLAVFFGAMLLAWNVLILGEFEYAVPAFPLWWHPLLLSALPAFALVLLARLAPVPFAATLAAAVFTLFRFGVWGGLELTAGLDLAGVTKPAIPLLLFAGAAADLLARRAPLWLTGVVVGLVAALSNLALAPLPWFPRDLLWALPAGALLAALLAWLGAWVAAALGPARADEPI